MSRFHLALGPEGRALRLSEAVLRVTFEQMFAAMERRPRSILEIGPEAMSGPKRELGFSAGEFDFVVTRGLLAQIALRDLSRVCGEIVRISGFYIGGIEVIGTDRSWYWQEIGSFYWQHFPELELIASGLVDGPEDHGLKIGWWVLRKPSANGFPFL